MIKHVIGDATDPIGGKGMKFIAHCCNNVGAWGAGFVLALSHRWGMPELMYRRWAQERPAELKESLGKIQVIPVEKEIMVVNIIGQVGVCSKEGIPPIRYDAIKIGLDKTQKTMEDYASKNPTLHLPRIGAGLAGGDWNKIEEILKETMEFPTIVYTLPFEAEKYEMKDDIQEDITS